MFEENKIFVDEQAKYIEELTARVGVLEKKAAAHEAGSKSMTIFLTSNSLDKVTSALMVANWAASMGYQVTFYCSLWAVSLFRKKNIYKENSLLEKTAKLMMKPGPEKATLSQMHMMGMGTVFMKLLMKEHNFADLKTLMESAHDMGIKFYICETMMGLMGVKKEELVEEVQIISGLSYIEIMSKSSVNFMV